MEPNVGNFRKSKFFHSGISDIDSFLRTLLVHWNNFQLKSVLHSSLSKRQRWFHQKRNLILRTLHFNETLFTEINTMNFSLSYNTMHVSATVILSASPGVHGTSSQHLALLQADRTCSLCYSAVPTEWYFLIQIVVLQTNPILFQRHCNCELCRGTHHWLRCLSCLFCSSICSWNMSTPSGMLTSISIKTIFEHKCWYHYLDIQFGHGIKLFYNNLDLVTWNWISYWG